MLVVMDIPALASAYGFTFEDTERGWLIGHTLAPQQEFDLDDRERLSRTLEGFDRWIKTRRDLAQQTEIHLIPRIHPGNEDKTLARCGAPGNANPNGGWASIEGSLTAYLKVPEAEAAAHRITNDVYLVYVRSRALGGARPLADRAP